ncbi:hypothetical protein niasHS_000600 [Heterodera schachtii]|uniref:TPM domain-containing protein n=2 Tax=Heterodera TaxID=34509 RepID=A0ABD2K4P9_HETSC
MFCQIPPLFLSLFVLFFCPSVVAQRTQWDAFNFPNPTAPGDFHRCKMRSTALLCDPDEVLSEQERYRLNYELGLIESATRQENGREFCERKGINAAVAIARQVKGGQEQDVRNMANDLLRRWTLDKQCEKAIVIVLSLEDRRFWVARMPRVPVYAQEFTELFKREQGTFKTGRNSEGLQNVIRAIRDRALSKQFPSARPDDDGRSKGTPFVPVPKPTPHPEGKHRQRGGGGVLSWLLIFLVIVFVVIPLACCCCCLYFCFFRKKDSGSNNRTPHNAENGGTGAERRGGTGLPLVGMLSGIGGAASNLFSKTRRRGAATDEGGGAQPAPPPPYSPVSQDDKKSPSLYPSLPVKDQGGGGSF